MITKKTSKELLADSLSELLEEKSFEKITVTEIASNCGIAKRTFYYYFKDKYELALWLYIRQLDFYYEASQSAVTFHSFIVHSANVLWKDRLLIRNILQYSGQNNLTQAVYAPLIDRYLSLIQNIYGDDINAEIREAVAFFVGGMISYVEHNLSEQNPPPPEKTILIFEACIPRILQKYLNV